MRDGATSLPCSFLMLVTSQAERWTAASWRRRQGFLLATATGLVVVAPRAVGERFAQAPFHCAAAQVICQFVVFCVVVVVGAFAVPADFLVWWSLSCDPLLSCPTAEAVGFTRIPVMVLDGGALDDCCEHGVAGRRGVVELITGTNCLLQRVAIGGRWLSLVGGGGGCPS